MLVCSCMWAALPLDSLSSDTTTFNSEFWGETVTKNQVIYNQTNQIMMYSNGNALSYDDAGFMKIGNSSKASAFVFRIAEESDIAITLGYNGSNSTVTLYYLGADEPEELTSSNLATAGIRTCGTASITSTYEGALTAKACATGYYKVASSLRFSVKNIILSAPTAADHTQATVTNIKLDGIAIAGFNAAQLNYSYELEFDATAAPIVSAETDNDATVQITQASTIPGAATVVCTSYDESASVTYTINFTKEAETPIIRATYVNKNSTIIKGSIGGTVAKNMQDDGKLGKDGHYFGITLTDSAFLAGDSLVIVATLNGGNTATLFADKDGNTAIASPEFDANTGICSYILTEDVTSIFLVRKTSACNPTIKMMQVYRPVDDGQPKLNVSVAEINLHVTAENPSVSATMKFTGKNLAAGNYSLTVPNVADMTVTPASVTVGEDGKLNAEITVTYASQAEVAAASAAISLTIGELTKSVTVNYSAAHAKSYMEGALYIDELILINGKSYDIASALTANNIVYSQIDALDSLNDDKAARNLPYLGLKLKKQGAYLAGWLKAGETIRLRFGYVGDSIKASIDGNEMFWNPAENVLEDKEFTASADSYMKFETTSSKTVVVKQITINAALKDDIELPAPTSIENITSEAKAIKRIVNGQLFIEKNGKVYNVLGIETR